MNPATQPLRSRGNALNCHQNQCAPAETKKSNPPRSKQFTIGRTQKASKRGVSILVNLLRLWDAQSLARIFSAFRVGRLADREGYNHWRSTTITLASHRHAGRKVRHWYCMNLAVNKRVAIHNWRRQREEAPQNRRDCHDFERKVRAVKSLKFYYRHQDALRLRMTCAQMIRNWETSCWFVLLTVLDADANDLEHSWGLQLQQMEMERDMLRDESLQRVELIVGLIRENQKKQLQINQLNARISGLPVCSSPGSPKQRVVQVVDTLTGQQLQVQHSPNSRAHFKARDSKPQPGDQTEITSPRSSCSTSLSSEDDDSEDDEAAVVLHNPEFLKLLEAEMLTPGIALLCTPRRSPATPKIKNIKQHLPKLLSTIEEDPPCPDSSPLPKLDISHIQTYEQTLVRRSRFR